MALAPGDPHAHARPGSSRNFPGLSPGDPHSHSRPEFARVTDIHLELNVDIEQKVLEGKAILTIEKIEPSRSNEVILDSYKLDISEVTDVVTGVNLICETSEHNDTFGSKFSIQLPQAADNRCRIQIKYKTSPDSPSLYWLQPGQTVGGSCFLLSNNKLIHARSWFPCQDTPSVRFKYSAAIVAPEEYKVLMSALLQNNPISDGNVYRFSQEKSIPSYAVVIAVGVLKHEPLSERIGMWTENMSAEYVTLSKQTFVKTQDMLRIAEDLYGTYPWDSLDICVLPPSVSHFEIECPRLIFVSATLLGGDISLVSSITRNISQHWTGISVTCANYKHLWLNKTFSLYIYRTILAVLFDEDTVQLIRRRDLDDLKIMIRQHESLGLLTCLLPDTNDLFSNEGTKHVPYEKGYILLIRLQNNLGGSIKFQQFLKSYLTTFAYSSITTDDWREYLYTYFSRKSDKIDSIISNYWFHDSNYPLELFCQKTLQRGFIKEKMCHSLAERWINWNDATNSHFRRTDIEDFCDVQKIVFLNYLHRSDTILSEKKMDVMANTYQFDGQNDEIRFVWLRLCIKSRWRMRITTAFEFAIKFSSPKFTYPIIEDLYNWSEVRGIVDELYANERVEKRDILNEIDNKIKQILHVGDGNLFNRLEGNDNLRVQDDSLNSILNAVIDDYTLLNTPKLLR